jgi:osmotically-inducible protein OsmY
MNRSTSNKSIYVWIGALLLTNTLPGCAVYRADEKCGWGGCPGDAKITASVRARLAQHPELGPPDYVYVRTVNHVVYLEGRVRSRFDIDAAASVARQVAGVTEVVNGLGVNEANGG